MPDGKYAIPTHEQAYMVHDQQFKQINARLKGHDAFANKVITITADQKASLDRIHERLDEWKEQTTAIVSLGKSVEHMISQQEKTQDNITKMLEKQSEQDLKIHGLETQMYSTKIADLEERIEELEDKPGKTALLYIDKVTSYLVIAFVVFVLGAIWYYLKGNI
jgi:TPP-dependent trihydroxycyclohexane-1,2-dione (THcHDO) dehydratase